MEVTSLLKRQLIAEENLGYFKTRKRGQVLQFFCNLSNSGVCFRLIPLRSEKYLDPYGIILGKNSLHQTKPIFKKQ